MNLSRSVERLSYLRAEVGGVGIIIDDLLSATTQVPELPYSLPPSLTHQRPPHSVADDLDNTSDVLGRPTLTQWLNRPLPQTSHHHLSNVARSSYLGTKALARHP